MKKVLPFYVVATLCLFSALFSVLTLMTSDEPELDSESAEKSIKEEVASTPPPPQLDFPNLMPGRTYSVSHPTTVVESPEGITDEAEELPAGGFFRVDDALHIDESLWYRVTVSNGFDDYTMYLKAEELNWKSVDWKLTADDQQTKRMDDLLERFEIIARERYPEIDMQPDPEPAPVVKEPITIDSIMASITSQGMFISALMAGMATLAIVFILAFVVYYRSTHRWSGSGEFDDFTSEMGGDADEDYGERELPGDDGEF